MAVVIRRAHILDASMILAALLEMHGAAAVRLPRVKGDKALAKIGWVIENGVALIAERDGEFAGTVGGHLAEDWYSDEKFLGDIWFYVRPACRASRAAPMLRDAFIQAGRDMCIPVRMGEFNGNDSDRKEKFFARAGMTKVGSVFVEGM